MRLTTKEVGNLKKNSKKPEVRKKELIDVAAALFAEKGYEAVSVRDILDVVGGAPGMFYYYFKSKQDIYIAAMEQYISERLERKCEIIEDDTIPFEEKLIVFRSMIEEDIKGYAERFDPKADASISDTSYKLWDLVQMLNRMVKPYARFMLQGIEEGKIKNVLGVTEETAEAQALFILYGCWGMIYNGKFVKESREYEIEDVLKVTDKLFH